MIFSAEGAFQISRTFLERAFSPKPCRRESYGGAIGYFGAGPLALKSLSTHSKKLWVMERAPRRFDGKPANCLQLSKHREDPVCRLFCKHKRFPAMRVHSQSGGGPRALQSAGAHPEVHPHRYCAPRQDARLKLLGSRLRWPIINLRQF